MSNRKKHQGIPYFDETRGWKNSNFATIETLKPFLGKLIVSTLAIVITAYIMPGVHVDSVLTALLVALVLSLLNAFVKPILIFLTLPVTLVTLGLFLLVINALMILLAGRLVEGFHLHGFWTAFFFSMVLSLVNAVLSSFTPKESGPPPPKGDAP